MVTSESESVERGQIRLARVICIFFMMSVHVPPGLEQASAITTGDFALLGRIWGDILGRASVASLSFISGYLFWRTMRQARLAEVVRRKFRTLILPMLTWNVIFVAVYVAGTLASGGTPAPERNPFAAGADPVAALTGLTGPTANQALFFLRDLFVALVLLRLLAPWLARAPLPILAAIAGITLFDLVEPVIFRPSILFFTAAGAVAAQRIDRLSALCRPRLVLPAGIALLLAFGLVRLSAGALGPAGAEAVNLLGRSLLVLAILPVSLWLTRTRVGEALARLEPRIFETYLLHVPLIGGLWVFWSTAVGGARNDLYTLFFLASPLFALLVAQVTSAATDRLPAAAQLALRGKARGTGAAGPAAIRAVS